MLKDEWKEQAACLGLSDEQTQWFFSTDKTEQSKAKQYCADCPAKQQCLQYAIEETLYGVWGGQYFDEESNKKGYHPGMVPCPAGKHKIQPKNKHRRCVMCSREIASAVRAKGLEYCYMCQSGFTWRKGMPGTKKICANCWPLERERRRVSRLHARGTSDRLKDVSAKAGTFAVRGKVTGAARDFMSDVERTRR